MLNNMHQQGIRFLIRSVALWIFAMVSVFAVIIPLMMNGKTNANMSSFWYYIVSTLGIYHSYSPTINTTLGPVRGIVSVSREGREYYEFRGIPYGKAPVDELRFEAPLPAELWEGLFTADKFGPPCLQYDAMVKGEVLGDEDCLNLHVYTPNLEPEVFLEILVYIHGGGFTGGEAALYNPKYIMDHDVVLVTFNYRLASLGFLNTGDDLIRGNMGLKDQNMALRWVKDNAECFGGDANKITLMGESAGAASVHYHIISPLSRGLFQRALMQSGNLGSPWPFTRNPQHQALRFGELLNCSVDNTTVLVDCLRKMDPVDIVKHHVAIFSPVHKQDDFFAGSVEAVQRDDTFLSENPYLMLERGDFAHVPIILGTNSGEGGLKTARLEAFPDILNELDTKWNEHIPVLMHYDPNRTEISERLRDYYFSDKVDPAKDLVNLTQMLGVGLFFEGNHRIAKYHAKFAPTYLYYYTYISKSLPSAYSFIQAAKHQTRWWYPWTINYAERFTTYYAKMMMWPSTNPKRFGASHGDDILQIFSMNPVVDVKMMFSDYPFSKELVATIVQFASDDLDNLAFNNVSWTPMNVRDKRPKYMELNESGGMIDEPFTEEVEFFESLQIREPLEPKNW